MWASASLQRLPAGKVADLVGRRDGHRMGWRRCAYHSQALPDPDLHLLSQLPTLHSLFPMVDLTLAISSFKFNKMSPQTSRSDHHILVLELDIHTNPVTGLVLRFMCLL